jgi:hypothetical protein
MNNLLNKLNYKGQQRILILNADDNVAEILSEDLINVQIDREIDQKFPYDFMLLFVKSQAEVETFAPMAVHNLLANGTLWFCYPKKSSKKYSGNIDRDHGWKTLNDTGFYGIRMVAIDADWSALRFRNEKYIKSASDKYKQPLPGNN